MINAFNYKTLILIGPNYREADSFINNWAIPESRLPFRSIGIVPIFAIPLEILLLPIIEILFKHIIYLYCSVELLLTGVCITYFRLVKRWRKLPIFLLNHGNRINNL